MKTYVGIGGFGSALVVCGLLVALPFWVGEFVPLLDLPQHLAIATILRHLGEPAWGFDRIFEAEWTEITPYWLHYLGLWLLSFPFSVETAGRVYLTLYALALPWAAGSLCAALGRPRTVGLMAAPLVLGSNLYFGFLAYCTGAVLLLFALAALERHRQSRGSQSALALALLTVALFFAHVQALAFFVLCAVLLAIRDGTSFRARARTLVPLAPAVLGLAAPWAYRQFVENAPRRYFGRVGGTLGVQFQPFWDNVAAFPSAVAGSFRDGSDSWIFGAWVVAVALLAFRGRSPSGERTPDRAARWSALLATVALACYFLTPMSIRGQWNINPRFAFLAALLVLPLVRTTGPWGTRPVIATALALSLLSGLNAVRVHRAFDREVGPFGQALNAIPPRQRVLGLIYDRRGETFERWPYLHFAQYAVVRHGGMASASFAHSGPVPVRFRPDAEGPEPDAWRPNQFDWQTQAGRFDYALVHGGPRSEHTLFGPGATLVEKVFEGGSWRVYRMERTLPPAPVASPLPPPDPPF